MRVDIVWMILTLVWVVLDGFKGDFAQAVVWASIFIYVAMNLNEKLEDGK